MTEYVCNVGVRLQDAVDSATFRFRCAIRQAELYVQNKYKTYAGEAFMERIISLKDCLGRRKTLRTQIKNTCPRFQLTR